MDAKEFDAALAKALGVCRAAADLELPIEAMLEHVADAIEAGLVAQQDGVSAAVELLSLPTPEAVAELEALREIIASVADVAAIGAKLPRKVPVPTPEPDFPMPANLRRT